MTLAPEAEAMLEEAKRFAALSGSFPPEQALPGKDRLPIELAIEVASALAATCDTEPSGRSGRWLLRTAERRYILATMKDRGELDRAIEERRLSVGPADRPTEDLLAALQGRGDFTPGNVRARIRQSGPREELERLILALDRAGEVAPAYPLLSSARAALGRLRREERWAVLSSQGFFGRRGELAKIDAWLKTPVTGSPAKLLFITGLAGVGKSSLLERGARKAFKRNRSINIRIDFERGGLDARDLLGLTMEMARQVADRLGHRGKALLEARLEAANVTSLPFSPEDSARMLLPLGLVEQIAAAVRKSKRPVCFIFDTMELLRARGESHSEVLFRWIDGLADAGLGPYWVIGAGRGDAFPSDSDRVAERIELSGLGGACAVALLKNLKVPSDLHGRIQAVAGDHPLALRLAAEAVAEPDGTEQADEKGLGRAVARGLIYRTLLARIDDAELRGIVHGLIVPRINAALIGEVIAPAIGAGRLDSTASDRLFRRLARLQWLVRRDEDDGDFIGLRRDIRAALLPLLYIDEAEQCARINQAAAEWFEASGEAAAKVSALYHRLQLTRDGRDPPEVDSELALQLDDELMSELPEPARNRVLAARGERTGLARRHEGRRTAVPDHSVAAELLSICTRRDWSEGRHFISILRARGDIERSAEIADAVMTFCWRSGNWAEARRLAEARGGAGPRSLLDLPPAVALAQLEMTAELDPAGFSRAFRRRLALDAAPLGAGASSSDGLATQGALVFLTLKRDRDRSDTARLSLPEAAFETWGGADDAGYARAARDAGVARMSLRMRRPPDLSTGSAGFAEAYAVLTPYAALLAALATDPAKGGVVDAAREADRRLAGTGPDAIAPRPDDPLSGITDLGLFSEWLSAFASIRQDPDLMLLAASAERWRRTVAGAWSFGLPPPKWQQRAQDEVLAHRLRRLREGQGNASDRRWLKVGGSQPFRAESRPRRRSDGAARGFGLLTERTSATRAGGRASDVHSGGGRTGLYDIWKGSKTMNEERVARVEGLLKNSALGEAATRAINEGRLSPALQADLSRASLEKFNRGGAALESVGPVDALEAIIRLTGRPPMLVRNDRVEMQPLPDFPKGTDVLIRALEKWIPSVGRVEFVNSSTKWGGTGWVIGKDSQGHIVATNRHVAKIVAKRAADGRGVFLRSAVTGVELGAEIDFSEELGTTAGRTRTARVTSIDYLADDTAADVALLRIASPAIKMPSPLQLSAKEAAEGDLVALIGYPAFDSRNDASAQARYFNDIYEVKRFAPGMVTQALSSSTLLMHDCTSLGGNSGSPLISLQTGKVVGLHFAGVYGENNSAVGVTTLQKLLKGGGRTVVGYQAGGASEGVRDGSHTAKELEGRGGYDPDFLGGKLEAPWPKMPRAEEKGLAKPSDAARGRANELRYTHFSVKYSATRKLPMMTAVNIDGSKAVRIKRSQDKWFSDGRIPREIQLGEANFKDLQIDRGHLVRREDPNWGDSGEEAQLANDDTFHYVNAAAQHSLLNQGKQLWQGLENYILDSARTRGFKACVFTGPIPRPDDPVLDGAPVPMEFWKLVAMVGLDGQLHATAYLLSQGQLIRELMAKRAKTEGMEGFVLGDFRTFQISVKDLAEGTGYDFSAYEKADPLAKVKGAQEAISSGEPVVLPVEHATELVL